MEKCLTDLKFDKCIGCVTNAPVGMCLITKDGDIINANNRFLQYFEYTLKQLKNFNIKQLLYNENLNYLPLTIDTPFKEIRKCITSTNNHFIAEITIVPITVIEGIQCYTLWIYPIEITCCKINENHNKEKYVYKPSPKLNKKYNTVLLVILIILVIINILL